MIQEIAEYQLIVDEDAYKAFYLANKGFHPVAPEKYPCWSHHENAEDARPDYIYLYEDQLAEMLAALHDLMNADK